MHIWKVFWGVTIQIIKYFITRLIRDINQIPNPFMVSQHGFGHAEIGASERPEDWPPLGFDGNKDGPLVPPLDHLFDRLPIRALHRYSEIAWIQAQALRDYAPGPKRFAVGTGRVLTMCLVDVWREHTGKAPWFSNSKESPAERFVTIAGRVVDPEFDGHGLLREIRAKGVRKRS